MEKEDGEMSDDHEMLVDDDDEFINKTPSQVEAPCTVIYKTEKDGLLIKQLEKIDAAKLEERAKRFGINLTGNRVVTQGQIDELYTNFGIESDNERHFCLDALYLNGVDGLTTREIFEYLEDYKPISLEWIDDISCNVVCQDHISAALALLVHSCEIKDEEIKEMLAEKSTHHWRLGMPHPKKDLIFMRFATNGEKKKHKKIKEPKKNDSTYYDNLDSVSKNPWGDLCKSWGVYDHQEVFTRRLPDTYSEEEIEEPRKPIQIRNKKLAMRLGKRQHKVEENSEESSSDSEWKSKSKTPRMRMHADDEESKRKKLQTAKVMRDIDQVKDKYAPLSIEIANYEKDMVQDVKREPTKLSDKFRFHNRNNQSGIRSRLGDKVSDPDEIPPDDGSIESDENMSDSEHNINISSKVQKINSKSSGSSVWSRLDIQQRSINTRLGSSSAPQSKDTQNDLRQMLKSKSQPKIQQNKSDLRERLGKSKHANLRIEIDNQ